MSHIFPPILLLITFKFDAIHIVKKGEETMYLQRFIKVFSVTVLLIDTFFENTYLNDKYLINLTLMIFS